jgi:acylphosphatase
MVKRLSASRLNVGAANRAGDAAVGRVTRRFLVSGKVQGVYFRHSTRVEAERLGVRGVARNLPDGRVEVIAQGARAPVESLHEWLHHGPSTARVAEVMELDVESSPEFGSFTVQ